MKHNRLAVNVIRMACASAARTVIAVVQEPCHSMSQGTGAKRLYCRPPTLETRALLAMPTVTFTANLRRHLACPTVEVEATTLGGSLEAAFAANPRVRGYVVDEQGRLRRHVVVFVDGARVRDGTGLASAVNAGSAIYVMQALSGG